MPDFISSRSEGTDSGNPLCPNCHRTLTIRSNWLGRPDFICESKPRYPSYQYYCYHVSVRQLKDRNGLW
jgi:hypothetical protein